MNDDDEMLAHRLRHEISRRMSDEERVIAGPEIPTVDAVKRRVLRDVLVKDAILVEATRTGEHPQAIEAHAARYFAEIAARYSPRVTSLFAASMTWAFDRIYDGITVDEIGYARVIEASRRGPLVFCPSHKSHVDYLVLSLALWNRGVTPPHIAAGANLSFFPLGPLFRGSGAFFLRRSFRANLVYSAVFRAYVIELVRRGTALEFFIEGTRSRTGKVLMPKLGLISMAVDAWRRGATDDIQFVPASVDYERIIEASSYERELNGAQKKPEGIAALLRTASVLRSRFGRVYLQFGEPVSLAALAREKGLPQDPAPEHDEAWRAGIVRLGYRILHQVASLGSVTPTAVAATALLGHPERGIAESSLLKRCQEIVDYLDGAAARLAETLADGTARDSALREAVRRFVEEGTVAVDRPGRSGQEAAYRVVEERRIALDFHKNAVMNTMAGDAIVCRALHRNGGRAGYREVRDDSRFLSRLFKREFLYRADRGFEACFDDHLATLAGRGFLDVHDDGRIIGREPAPTAILAGLLDSFVEAYWVMASTMADLRRSPLRQEEILGRAMERARRGFLEGRIARPECANRTLMQNAADWMLATGVIEAQVSGKERTLRLTPEYGLGRLETLIHDISVFL